MQIVKTPAKRYKSAVTICIAAIAESGMIIGASDTMMTDPVMGIEFELKPSSSGKTFINKISPISKNVMVMIAGASGLQTDILSRMIFDGHDLEKNHPKSVREVVEMYCKIYAQIRKERLNKTVYGLYGLDTETFISNQKDLTPELINEILKGISAFEMDYVQTIIAGVDDDGSHIYRLTGDQYSCCDMIGFCAIGSGASHAESQFMLAGYSRLFKQEDTLWITYLAKRKSEVAPGVGEEMVMFSLSAKTQESQILNNKFDMSELERHYELFKAEQKSAFDKAQLGFKNYLISNQQIPPTAT
jgi:20S proteasome alpha/beta subunit